MLSPDDSSISTLSVKSGVVLTSKFLIHTIHVTNFTTTNTYVACRNILIWAYIVTEFKHESLAESHNFSI